MPPRLSVLKGDITRLAVDAIVNAANESLLGGGGVDGAIHFAAGPELKQECATLGGCTVGNAKLTKGYKLPAKYVIHTVGPRWKGGTRHEPDQLAACYRRCLEVARAHDVHSIAFPAISTGAFGYPADLAADVAVSTIAAELATNALPEQVILVAYDGAAKQLLERRLAGALA